MCEVETNAIFMELRHMLCVQCWDICYMCKVETYAVCAKMRHMLYVESRDKCYILVIMIIHSGVGNLGSFRHHGFLQM